MTSLPVGVWLDHVSASAREHEAVRHEFLARIRGGEYDSTAMAHLIRAYATYSATFPDLVARVIANTPKSSEIRRVLAEVMDEELVDDAGVSHAELLIATADGLGVAYQPGLLAALQDHCLRYADVVRSIVESGLGQGLGLLGPATEWIVSDIYGNFVEWFGSHAPPDAPDSYFAFHVEADDGHARLLRDAIAMAIATRLVSREDVAAGAAKGLAARSELWASLGRIVQTSAVRPAPFEG